MDNVFSTYHPAVAFVFLACVIVFSMAAMHPVYVVISFIGAFIMSCVTRGFQADGAIPSPGSFRCGLS